MSGSDPMHERTVTAVLLSLWRQSGPSRQEAPLQQVLQETLAPLPDVHLAIETLTRRGCMIERSPAGLRLVTIGLPCWSDILAEEFRRAGTRLGGSAGRRVMVFSRTTSTNDVAWQCAASPENDGLVVLADEQTAGRGRLGHAWNARGGQSVLMSMLLRGVPGNTVDRLTLLAGLAAARGIEGACTAGRPGNLLPRIEIKWPNDLLLEGRKVAGILVERKGGEAAGHTVIGIGINVLQAREDFDPDLAARATSLWQATGARLDRLRVAAAVLHALDAHLPRTDNAWLEEWKGRCSMLGTRIRVRRGSVVIDGQVLDIDPLQGLMLRDGAGATHFLFRADVHTVELKPNLAAWPPFFLSDEHRREIHE